MFEDLIDLNKLKKILWYGVYMFAVLLFQDALLGDVELFGVRMMFLPAAVVAVGLFEDGVWGGVFGLVLGLIFDRCCGTTVLFTLLLPVIGFFSGMLSRWFVNKRFFAYMCVCLAALALTALCQGFRLWAILGQSGLTIIETVLIQTLWSLPMAAPWYFPSRAISRKKI